MNKQIIIEAKLLNDEEFVKFALLKLYDLQTADEQATRNSAHHNKRGFNVTDAPDLTLLAERYKENGTWYPKLFGKKIGDILYKYAKQLSNILTEEEIL